MRVEHHPAWTERWEEMHTETYACGTDSDGHTEYCTRVYYTTEYDHHPNHWEASRTFGSEDDDIIISESLYNEIKHYFGDVVKNGGNQSYDHGGAFIDGDRTIYATANDTHFLYPATKTKNFVNRIKATPNIFQFSKVPTNIVLYGWPSNPVWNRSDRLMGTAATSIGVMAFDQLNSRLGASKKVNLIMIGVGNKENIYGQYYEAAFMGGKKNDLVMVYGGGSGTNHATWAYCFGWTEHNLVKRNLETILLNYPINDAILGQIEKEVGKNYQIKDWKQFDYITVYAPAWVYIVFIILMLVVQVGLYIYFNLNDEDKSYWNR